ncbi:MAG TPA: sulfite reductase subunit alpha [Rhodomicrobium sp.]|nr:sulfite reductase subunit alpha [Rhodomicrobium sp.]
MTDMSPLLGKTPALIPEDAPFSDEQRSWLNGFFSGFIALERAAITGVAAIPALTGQPPAEIESDDAPWHDQTLQIAERMTLAEGRPLRRRMMAAMAQQDCGQCGYNCKDYSDAIADKKELRLNLCVPGGKETARMLKSLYQELDGAGATPAPTFAVDGQKAAAGETPAKPGTSRDCPAEAIFMERRHLNKSGSGKETWHIEFDLSAAGLDYTVGDSFGVFPENDPSLVREILMTLWTDPDQKRDGRTLAEILGQDYSLSPAPDSLFQLFSYLTGGEKRQKAKALAAGEDPDGDAATLDVLAALHKFQGVRPNIEAFFEALEPLQPRLYSISSSPKAAPGRLSLTVDCVRYKINRRMRLGCASTFLCDRIKPQTALKAYVQKAHNFGLPQDHATPVIMIGPGTGIAPFRAFLQERQAIGAKGKNWLFFGHQRRACDFFYEDELAEMKSAGLLTRLSLAWSRDGKEKFYVQDRMRETGRDLWAWLKEGAHFYICGDAKRMAKDVERALSDIACEHGRLSPDQAVGFIADLKKTKRFQADVY